MHHREFKRRAFTLIELLVVIAIIAVLIGLLVPAVQQVHGSAMRMSCQTHMSQIGLALHLHHDAKQRLPKSYGFGTLSWTYQVLPYIEQQAAYDQGIDASGIVYQLFRCPSDSNNTDAPYYWNQRQYSYTSYLGNAGRSYADRAGGGNDTGVLHLWPAHPGIRFTDIADGTDNTLMVGERPPGPDGFWGWFIGQGDFDTAMWSMLPKGYQPYGHDNLSQPCPSPAIFSQGKFNDPCSANHYWSAHDGGANFLMCDRSVHFISYAVGPDLLPALSTRAGGEPVNLLD